VYASAMLLRGGRVREYQGASEPSHGE